MSSRYIRPTEIALLWGRAGGSCSICRANLLKEFPESGNVNLGERAHIIPHSKNGPRGNGESEGENKYENLILLCGYHHTEIDKAFKEYSRCKLLKIKREHEKYVRDSIAKPERDKTLLKILDLLKLESDPEIVPVLSVDGGSYEYFSNIVPAFIRKILGGSFGHHRISLDLKNIGKKKANRVVLKLQPKKETMPQNFTFSTDKPITRNCTPYNFEKEVICGPFNVGELKNEPCIFYLNFREETTGDNSRRVISGIEFEYYLTCDDAAPTRGTLKIVNS